MPFLVERQRLMTLMIYVIQNTYFQIPNSSDRFPFVSCSRIHVSDILNEPNKTDEEGLMFSY